MGKESNPSRNKTRKANHYLGLKKPQIKNAIFLKKMRLFGYRPNEGGVCYGLSIIALHFILLNKLTQFDQLILALYRINHKVRKAHLAERALIEGVQFCHHPERYPHLFPTYTKNKKIKPVHDIANSLPVIASDELEAQGGAVCVDRFSGVYSISELTQLFQCMRTSIEQFPHTMTLLLSDDRHICALTYSVEKRAWSRIDATCLPSQKYVSDLAIAKAVARSLSVDLKKTVISGIVFVCGQSESIAKQAVAHRHVDKEWERIHAMNTNKKKYFPRWLLVSCYDGCEKNVQLLLENNVDPNKPRNEGCSPLYFSIKHGYYSVVKLLLSHGASANRTHKDETSPLSAAIKYGRDDIATLLKENGAKLRSRAHLSR